MSGDQIFFLCVWIAFVFLVCFLSWLERRGRDRRVQTWCSDEPLFTNKTKTTRRAADDPEWELEQRKARENTREKP